MLDQQGLPQFLERALAFAHTALKEPTRAHVLDARSHANEVLPRLQRIRRFQFTLSEARQIVLLVTQLRTVLAAVDRRSKEGRGSQRADVLCANCSVLT